MTLIASPGTITVTNGSSTITGTNTAFTTLREGYTLELPNGLSVTLAATPTDNASATIAMAWTGTTIADSAYQAKPRDTGSQIALDQRIQNQMLAATDAIGSAVGFKFETATEDAQPGDGYLRLVSATQINVSDLAVGNTNIASLLAQFVGGMVFMRSASRPESLNIYILQSLSDEDGYSALTVASVSGTATYNADESLVFLGAPTGPAGQDVFIYVAYASDAAGADFTTTFDANLDYIAILVTVTEVVAPSVGDFTGLWKNYKGATGQPPNLAIGTVTTLDPGQPATAQIAGTTPNYTMDFGIPEGNVGPQGPRGTDWRGSWNNVDSYVANDLVTDPDSEGDPAAWICLVANTNSKPKDNPTDWAFFPGSFPSLDDYGLISEAATETNDYGAIV